MGYPSGVQSFTSKNTGDTIQPAHVNDLQTEVSAVETGLLTGLQHALAISTGGLSVSTGSVNIGGPSSVATLQVNGGSTFVGSVTLSTYATQPVPTCKLTHSADQAVATSAYTGLSWDTEAMDAAGLHSTSANSSRITFAHSTGWYQVTANVEWNANSSGARLVRLMLNDATGIAAQCAASAGLQFPQSVTGLVRATSTTDYVTAQVFQNSGSTGSITNSTVYGTAFWVAKVTSL